MAEGQVNIVFNADTSQMTEAFAKVNSELASSSGGAATAFGGLRAEGNRTGASYVNWTQLAKDHAAAQEFMAGKVGKTAADFRAATAEQRAASVATEQLTQRTYGLVSAYVAYRIARAVYDTAKYIGTQSIERESSEVRFKNLAGNTEEATTAFEGLKKESKEVGINVNELADAGTTLLEAGVPAKDLATTLDTIAKKALVAGHPVGELADLVLRLGTRGEVTGRQLAMIAKLSGDETGKLSDMYKEMTITIPRITVELERQHRVEERTRREDELAFNRRKQDENRAYSYQEKIEEKLFSRRREDENQAYSYQQKITDIATGATGADVAAYRAAGGPPPSVRATRIQEIMRSYHVSQADAEFSIAGENAGPALIAKAAEQQRIGRETLAAQGVNVGAAIASGEIGPGPLMSAGRATTEHERETGQVAETRAHEDTRTAADEARTTGQIEESRKREDATLAWQHAYEDRITALETEKTDLKEQIATKGMAELVTPGPASADQYKKEEDTQGAHVRRAGAEVQALAQGAGSGLRGISDWIDSVTKRIGYDPAAHPVKGAQLPEHTLAAPRPGSPGFDLSTYKPPAQTVPEKDDVLAKLADGIASIVGLLQGAVGGG